MFKFNNTHIFTGYLKQLLASFNLPTCKVYTKNFAKYLEQNGIEDPMVVESFDTIEFVVNSQSKKRAANRINYLIGNEISHYLLKYDAANNSLDRTSGQWQQSAPLVYDSTKRIPGFTKTLSSPGTEYDTATHEYLGDYLRFVRDYYNVNLMSLYNCFTNKVCNNLFYSFKQSEDSESYITFDSQDARYRIYSLPVKLFQNYTIAIDCIDGVEMFCGLYKTSLESSDKSSDLIRKTYKKENGAIFSQPFLYDKLDVQNWSFSDATELSEGFPKLVNGNSADRFEIMTREQDLRLFIKVPTSCKSSIVILEGDYRTYNNSKYEFVDGHWSYQQNHSIINFDSKQDIDENSFGLISKVQLLAFNTGESYPFADKLVECLSNSTILPTDAIADNIKRAQKVMEQNNHYFKVSGLWENKMQKIIYDYIMSAGPVVKVNTSELDVQNTTDTTQKEKFVVHLKTSTKHEKALLVNKPLKEKHELVIDRRTGRHKKIGHAAKSTLYDVLGYVDKEAEKWYASWQVPESGTDAVVKDSIQNVDIYDGLFDI